MGGIFARAPDQAGRARMLSRSITCEQRSILIAPPRPLIPSSNLRQRLVCCFHQYPEPVLAQFGEPFHGAPLTEFSELPYDHVSQAIA